MNDATSVPVLEFVSAQRRRTLFAGRLFAAVSVVAAVIFALGHLVLPRPSLALVWAGAAFVPAILFLGLSLSSFDRKERFILPLHFLSLLGAMTMASRYAFLLYTHGGAGSGIPGLGSLVMAAALLVTYLLGAGVRKHFVFIVAPPLLVLTAAMLLASDRWQSALSEIATVWVLAAAGAVVSLAHERMLHSQSEMRSTIAKLEREIEDRRESTAELEKRAAIDDLTGVYNRRAGMDVLQQSIYLAQRNAQALTVSFIDVDDLKKVNDNYGHSEGDALLQRVVAVLKRHLRKSDSVCRLGGDEFLAVLPDCKKESARAIIDRIETDLAAERCAGGEYKIRISSGFAEYTMEHNVEIDELLKEADIDMYRTKQHKKLDGSH